MEASQPVTQEVPPQGKKKFPIWLIFVILASVLFLCCIVIGVAISIVIPVYSQTKGSGPDPLPCVMQRDGKSLPGHVDNDGECAVTPE